MLQFTFLNALGESITWSNVEPYILEKVEGISGGKTEIQGEKSPYQHGFTFIDALMDARNLSFIIQIRSDLAVNRRNAIRILNASLGIGVLTLNDNGIEYKIDCAIEQGPIFLEDHENRTNTFQRFVVDFVAPSPFWYGAMNQWTLASFTGGYSFPFAFNLTLGNVGANIILHNGGDIEAPLYIELVGPLENPVITNETTGEFIAVTQAIASGYKLVINTERGDKYIDIVNISTGIGTNGFQYIDTDSTLFSLVVGDNELTYTATVQPSPTAVTLFYKNKYIGV